MPGSIPATQPLNPKYRLFIQMWRKKLPTPIANLIYAAHRITGSVPVGDRANRGLEVGRDAVRRAHQGDWRQRQDVVRHVPRSPALSAGVGRRHVAVRGGAQSLAILVEDFGEHPLTLSTS